LYFSDFLCESDIIAYKLNARYPAFNLEVRHSPRLQGRKGRPAASLVPTKNGALFYEGVSKHIVIKESRRYDTPQLMRNAEPVSPSMDAKKPPPALNKVNRRGGSPRRPAEAPPLRNARHRGERALPPRRTAPGESGRPRLSGQRRPDSWRDAGGGGGPNQPGSPANYESIRLRIRGERRSLANHPPQPHKKRQTTRQPEKGRLKDAEPGGRGRTN
jgi:hypothetical protein